MTISKLFRPVGAVLLTWWLPLWLGLTPLRAQPAALPPAVVAALAQARVPHDAVAMLVVPVEAGAAPRLSHQASLPMNPASVTKLITTFAALDTLGPSYTWRTPVWLDGPVVGGVLKGNLVIQGQGDPKLVLERLWLLLRRVQSMGVQRISGHIVLDRRWFDASGAYPSDFDGDALRPYNVVSDALLLNYKSVVLTFTPDPQGTMARVQVDPPLAGVALPSHVPLNSTAPCGDYRAALQADFSNPLRIRLSGHYPSACGEKVWPVAYPDPASYNARALAGLWQSMGGALDGAVIDGPAPNTPATFEMVSPTLLEVVRDINKYSNNVMAQQLFLTLGRPPEGTAPATPVTPALAREALAQWWRKRLGPDVPVLDNGSGLSRLTRVSAQQLARLLQVAYASPTMPELLSSLPVSGVDGTLKRRPAARGSAHLKTGSLRDVVALGGVVHADSGKRYVLVAMVNHANAGLGRAALDALVEWAVMDNLGQ